MSDKEKLPPLERYIRILELLSAFPDGLSLTDVSIMVELPKASVHRLLKKMQELELVAPAGALGYVTGSRLRKLAFMSADMERIEAIVRPYLRELAAETGETSFIAKIEGTIVRSIANESPDTPWRGFVLPGHEMHPHAASSAKAILAFQDERTIARALREPLEKLTPATNTSKTRLMKEYETIRKTGYSVCIGEIDEGLAGVAVPIVIVGPEVVYSLGVTGPLNRVVSRDVAVLATVMKGYAKRIATGLSVGLAKRPK